jgi:hypothetical protein
VEKIYPRDSQTDCYQYVYEKLGLDYNLRWDSCPLETAVKNVKQVFTDTDEYAFVHHDPARGYLIDHNRISGEDRNYPVVMPVFWVDRSILSFASVIIDAQAGHVIDSAGSLE